MKNRFNTDGRSKAIYIVGAITLGIIALLAVYFVLIATGVISAEPVRIVVSSASVVKEYDGTAATIAEWQLKEGELKEGHTLEVEVTGAQVDVGKSENTLIATVYDAHGYDVTNSYGIVYEPGTIEVAPRKIVVSSDSAEKSYDGKPLTAKSCAITAGTLISGHEISYHINGTLTASGKANNTFVATVFDGARDITGNYDIEYLYGTLYVHGVMLNISTESKTKTYDGKPLTADKWALTSGDLAEGHVLSVAVTGAQTEIGESENYAHCSVKDANGVVVTDMYEPVFTFGTLTVEPVKIYVETRSAYKIYDGTPLTADGWRVINDGSLAGDTWLASGRTATVDGYSVTMSVIGSQTDAGTSDNKAVFVTVTYNGEPADGVEVVVKPGSLTVDKRNLTVQSGTAGKEYDGTPLVCDEWKIVSDTKPAEGHEVIVAVSGTITHIGSVANVIAEVKVMSGEDDVTRNYNVKIQEGILTVVGETPKPPETGGNGAGDLDDSGNLGGGSEGEEVVVMRILGDVDGKVYLRQMSYGDYAFNGWNKAESYGVTMGAKGMFGDVSYSMNYLTGIALASVGKTVRKLEVEPVGVSQYYLPYYLSLDELNYDIQSSDVVNTDNRGGNYAAYYYAYDYIEDGGKALASVVLGDAADYELAYREYVYDKYTAVPQSTLEYINGIIAENGFKDLALEKQIAAVASYVRNCAKYNLKYDTAMDAEPDVAVAFLDKYKEGVCRHYASAATLIYRALGLPARYTTGFVGTVKNGEWTDVTNKNGHAWAEVYIDGVGWIELEVTGGGAGFDGTDGNGGSSGGSDGAGKGGKLNIKPFDVYLHFNDYKGEPLTYGLDTLQGLTDITAKGYTYEFTVSGSQDGLGIGKSRIDSFTLFDASGADVTDKFEIKRDVGILQVYIQELDLSTPSYTRMYDGTPLTGSDGEYTCKGTLLYGHEIASVEFTGERTIVGRGVNTCDIVIADKDGADVTYMYKINKKFGTLNVTARALDVIAGSVVGYLNELGGEPLTCEEYEIGAHCDGLAEGDTIVIKFTGAQKGVGRAENGIASVVIKNADGFDVTECYKVTCQSGTITVLPRRPVSAAFSEDM